MGRCQSRPKPAVLAISIQLPAVAQDASAQILFTNLNVQVPRCYLRNGASVIKLFVGGGVASQFGPLEAVKAIDSEIRAVVETTEDFGTYVCVHAFNDESDNRALDAGVRCVEHGFLMEEETVKPRVEEGQVLSLQTWIGYKSLAKAKMVHENTDKVMGWVVKYGVETFAGTDMYDSTMVPLVTEDLIVRKRWIDAC